MQYSTFSGTSIGGSGVVDLNSPLGRLENMCLPTHPKFHIPLARAIAEKSPADMGTL